MPALQLATVPNAPSVVYTLPPVPQTSVYTNELPKATSILAPWEEQAQDDEDTITVSLSTEEDEENSLEARGYNLQSSLMPRISGNQVQFTVQNRVFNIDLKANKLPKGQELTANQIGFRYLGRNRSGKSNYHWKWELFGAGDEGVYIFAKGSQAKNIQISTLSAADVEILKGLEVGAYYGITNPSLLVSRNEFQHL